MSPCRFPSASTAPHGASRITFCSPQRRRGAFSHVVGGEAAPMWLRAIPGHAAGSTAVPEPPERERLLSLRCWPFLYKDRPSPCPGRRPLGTGTPPRRHGLNGAPVGRNALPVTQTQGTGPRSPRLGAAGDRQTDAGPSGRRDAVARGDMSVLMWPHATSASRLDAASTRGAHGCRLPQLMAKSGEDGTIAPFLRAHEVGAAQATWPPARPLLALQGSRWGFLSSPPRYSICVSVPPVA